MRDARHLAILEQRCRPQDRTRLGTAVAVLPDVEFAAGRFSAVLAARVLHFLTGPQIAGSLRSMRSWLAPGGKAFLVADTL